MYTPRLVETRLHGLLQAFPVTLVTGPRQCGKSTMVANHLSDWARIDLENPDEHALLVADLMGFFEAHPDHVAIDEAQRFPGLLPALRYVIDQDRRPGRYLLLGSASPDLIMAASESLAGRMAFVELTPFLATELAGGTSWVARWYWGGFPPVHGHTDGWNREEWLNSYVSAFLERDLPTLGIDIPAARLRTLWAMLTHAPLRIGDDARHQVEREDLLGAPLVADGISRRIDEPVPDGSEGA